MVSFNCHGCGDVVKKPKLDQHRGRCHAAFDCIDCHTTFKGPAEYKGHTSCISEAEKYQKSLYKGPKSDGVAPRNNYPPQSQAANIRHGGGGSRGGFRQAWGPARYQATGANGTPLGTPARMSPATQDQPEPPPSTQTSVAHVDKADVVASEILAEKPAVEKKKEKKDKKEKREKKRKSAVIDDEAAALASPEIKHDEPPSKKRKAIDPASIPLPPSSPVKSIKDGAKEKPAKKSKSKKDKYAAEKEKREKKRAMKLAAGARGTDDGNKTHLAPTKDDVVMGDVEVTVEKKIKKHKRAEGENGGERESKKRKRDLAVHSREVGEAEVTQDSKSDPSQSDLGVGHTDRKKDKKAKKRDPDAMEVDAEVVEKREKKEKKSKKSKLSGPPVPVLV